MIAGREELEDLIEFRIRQQRDEILDGVHKAIELGPEWIDRLEGTFDDSPEVPLATTEEPEEADLAIAQRVTREPASTLDEQLNEDIARWLGRGDDFVSAQALWEYYAGFEELRLDDVALRFLTQSSLKNRILGVFWLEKAKEMTRQEILLETPNNHHRIERAGKLLLLMDNMDTFDTLMEQSTSDASVGDLRTCKEKMGNSKSNRVRYLLRSDDEYSLKYSDWSEKFRARELDKGEIYDLIPSIADQFVEIQELYERGEAWSLREQFRDALWDLEVVLGGEVFN
jgi:hypothetical protein